jgi:hypothetical protein
MVKGFAGSPLPAASVNAYVAFCPAVTVSLRPFVLSTGGGKTFSETVLATAGFATDFAVTLTTSVLERLAGAANVADVGVVVVNVPQLVPVQVGPARDQVTPEATVVGSTVAVKTCVPPV